MPSKRKRNMVSSSPSNPNSLKNRNGDEEEEPNSRSHNSDFFSKGIFELIDDDDGEVDEDDDVELQRVLFQSCFDIKSPNDDDVRNNKNKNKGVQLSSPLIYPRRRRWWESSSSSSNFFNEAEAAGESSVTECGICKDTKSSGSVLRANNKCRHPFCEDCIKNYVGEKLQENIFQIKCPGEKCNQFLEQWLWKKFVPERLDWVRDQALIEASVLENPCVTWCPSEDCRQLIVDDGRNFPIRACPNCWKIYCAKCMAPAWHKGMSCDEYKRVLKYRENLSILIAIGKEQEADPSYAADGDMVIVLPSEILQFFLDPETYNLARMARSMFKND